MGVALFLFSVVIGYLITEIIFWIIDKPEKHNQRGKEGNLPSFKMVFAVVTILLFIVFVVIFLSGNH